MDFHYIAKAHMRILKKHNIKISMDGVGRATDNVYLERFLRGIKYEEVYLNEYQNMKVLKKIITYTCCVGLKVRINTGFKKRIKEGPT